MKTQYKKIKMRILESIQRLFSQEDKSQNVAYLEDRVKNLELVSLKQDKKLAELESSIAELQFSVNIIVNTCQKLSEEISILYTAIHGSTGGSSMFNFNFRGSGEDDNWEN